MSLILVKFLEAGKWGDHPADPLFEVKEGEEKKVSAGLANAAIEAGKAEFVKPKAKPEPEAGPVKKAEGKSVKKKAEGK